MPDGDRYELVNGELVERDMGFKSSRIGGRFYRFLSVYCEDNGLGWVAPADASFQCFPDDPEKVRKPDASFIRAERMPSDQQPEGHCRLVPDAAAEVVSPNDTYSDVEIKVDEYLQAGVLLVWVIHPATRSVRVHRRDGTMSDLREDDELTGENVIPGFRCRVSDLFADPVPKTSERGTAV